MNGYGNGTTTRGASAPDIRAMLAASFADEQEPMTAMLYAQDADRKLHEAKTAKAEAERYRAEMQRSTAESVWESARAELDRATTLRHESEEIFSTARADADEYRRTAVAEAEREAIAIKDTARSEVNAELAERQAIVDDEIRNALTAIDKMQSAPQAELEAQQMHTEALRFRAASPASEPEPAAAPAPRQQRTARKTRQG